MRQGFSNQDLKTRDQTPRATGGMHVKGVHGKTRKPRKDHDHRVGLGQLPMSHGESHGTDKMIMNHKGGDNTSMQNMKSARHQVGKHRISLAAC
jgi:hypothetical protein